MIEAECLGSIILTRQNGMVAIACLLVSKPMSSPISTQSHEHADLCWFPLLPARGRENMASVGPVMLHRWDPR